MSTLPSLDVSEFDAFFTDVHGVQPFPWQQRLVERVATGGWPAVLALPTGSGKTAALDVAVFALALNAVAAPRTQALRIIYVIDRRTVVDQAYQRAERLRACLDKADSDVVRRVRQRLAYCSAEGVPLQTAVLRGGIARDDEWTRSPLQPVIAVSTVDQVGSRLLFRGYGISDGMKPVHAGLLGTDALFLLDEVHLSQPFRETVVAIRDRYRGWAERPLAAPFAVVEMSATPGELPDNSFELDDADRRNPVLMTRLAVSKPVSLVETRASGFTKEILKQVAAGLKGSAAAVAVVVNRVNRARDIHEQIRAAHSGLDTYLVTGRMRPLDRRDLEKNLIPRIAAGRTRGGSERPVVVVATQTIEAGADFDFDMVISECASFDALRQRFGRLDRLGALEGRGRGAIVALQDGMSNDPVYGDAIGHTWEWLGSVAEDSVVDFGIDRLQVPGDARDRGLLSPRRPAPVLLPSHLDFWAQTSPMPVPDPDVELWLHGPQSAAADVQVIWRADLSETLLTAALDAGEQEVTRELPVEIVELLPPVSGEAMAVPLSAVRRWLSGTVEQDEFDVEGAGDGEDDTERQMSATVRPTVVWQGDQSSVRPGHRIRPGQTLVVPSEYGGIRDSNWCPAEKSAVLDLAEIASFEQGRPPRLRSHPAVLSQWFPAGTEALVVGDPNEDSRSPRDVAVAWLETLRGPSDPRMAPVIESLLSLPKTIRISVQSVPPISYAVLTGRRLPETRLPAVVSDAAGDSRLSSFTGIEVRLSEHLDGVAAFVQLLATRLGLPAELTSDLVLAARWHDSGKADPRFQRWLHGGSEYKLLTQREPLAKSREAVLSRHELQASRERAGYPAGCRHELLSVALMEAAESAFRDAAHDWELVLHLVGSHHGYCRPLAPVLVDEHPVPVIFERGALSVATSSAHDLARIDSGVADRFWILVQRYGWWGLAWLEAILRLADHRRSAFEQDTTVSRHA